MCSGLIISMESCFCKSKGTPFVFHLRPFKVPFPMGDLCESEGYFLWGLILFLICLSGQIKISLTRRKSL